MGMLSLDHILISETSTMVLPDLEHPYPEMQDF